MRTQHRTSNLRTLRSFCQQDAVLNVKVRHGATRDQRRSRSSRCREVSCKFPTLGLAIPARGVERFTIGCGSDPLAIAACALRWPASIGRAIYARRGRWRLRGTPCLLRPGRGRRTGCWPGHGSGKFERRWRHRQRFRQVGGRLDHRLGLRLRGLGWRLLCFRFALRLFGSGKIAGLDRHKIGAVAFIAGYTPSKRQQEQDEKHLDHERDCEAYEAVPAASIARALAPRVDFIMIG